MRAYNTQLTNLAAVAVLAVGLILCATLPAPATADCCSSRCGLDCPFGQECDTCDGGECRCKFSAVFILVFLVVFSLLTFGGCYWYGRHAAAQNEDQCNGAGQCCICLCCGFCGLGGYRLGYTDGAKTEPASGEQPVAEMQSRA